MRELAELIDRYEPALPLLNRWIADPAGNGGVLLTPVDDLRTTTLIHMQVTTRSVLGAIAYETGGVSIAEGLIRLLGSGLQRSLLKTADAAGCPLDGSYPDIILIGDDVLGGLFALNGGRFGPDDLGQVFHLAADEMSWIPLGIGHTDFVSWCCKGDLRQFYGPLTELSAYANTPRPGFNETYSFYPFLWTEEAKEQQSDARVIPATESLKLRLDVCGYAVC